MEKTNNKWFTVELNLSDWGSLDERAIEKGYKNSREMILAEMKKLSKDKSFNQKCEGARKKHKNNYEIPEDLKDFFSNLACQHSTTISGAIYRYVILPELILQKVKSKNKKSKKD